MTWLAEKDLPQLNIRDTTDLKRREAFVANWCGRTVLSTLREVEPALAL
ncbi:hypothetical protein [Actinokineospora inagensis]|nr:hypothetical protein [Actinokineospora inagensis]